MLSGDENALRVVEDDLAKQQTANDELKRRIENANREAAVILLKK